MPKYRINIVLVFFVFLASLI